MRRIGDGVKISEAILKSLLFGLVGLLMSTIATVLIIILVVISKSPTSEFLETFDYILRRWSNDLISGEPIILYAWLGLSLIFVLSILFVNKYSDDNENNR